MLRPFTIGDQVMTPEGAIGTVVGYTVHGSVRVHLPLADLTFPWSPEDLVGHDPSGRGCALAGRARAGHDVTRSDVCRLCLADR